MSTLLPAAVPGTTITSTTAKPGPLASVEEAFSFAAQAIVLYRIKALSLLANAWFMMYTACVQPVGHSVGACEVPVVRQYRRHQGYQRRS